MQIEVRSPLADTVTMNQLLLTNSQEASWTRVRQYGLLLVLLLLISSASIPCLAQQFGSQLSKDQNAINPSWGEAKVALSPAPAQPPAVSPANTDPVAILSSARAIYVSSTSLLVGASTVEEKLRGRAEFQQLRMLITRDEARADLILEVRHDVLTKYVYTAIDPKTQIVVATGKVSSLGGTVAGKVAKRFLKQVTRARMQGRGTDFSL